MNPRASYNFHLPLPSDLHEMLRDEVERSGQPATTLARQALYDWLKQRRKQRLYEEIAAYAAAHAGTEADLDPALEQVGLESILVASTIEGFAREIDRATAVLGTR